MEHLRKTCEQQGVPIEKLLELALKNLEAREAKIDCLQQEKKILEEKLSTQNRQWAADNQQLEQRLALNERMFKEMELTRAYDIARLNLSKSTQYQDTLLFKLRLEDALDDLEELQMRFQVLMLQLKEEQAKAETFKQRFLKREREISNQQSSERILEVEQRAQNLQESLVRMEKDHQDEIRKANSEHKRARSMRKQEESALLRERDFVWNQLKRMEEDYASRLRSKNEQLQVAHQNIEKLHLTIEELQRANDERNVELTVLKVEMGECKREAQKLKEGDLKHLKCNESQRKLKSVGQIMEEVKDNEPGVLFTRGSGDGETEEKFPESNSDQHQTSPQDIDITPGTLRAENNLEKKSQSTAFMKEKEKPEMILETLEGVQPENKNQESIRNNVAYKDQMCRNLNSELEDAAICSDPARQAFNDKSVLEKRQPDNDDVLDNMNSLQDIPERQDKQVLEDKVNACVRQNSHLTKENITRSINSNKRKPDAKALDFQCDGALKNSNSAKKNRSIDSHKRLREGYDLRSQVKTRSQSLRMQTCKCPSSKKKNSRSTLSGSQENVESQQHLGHATKYYEKLCPVRANFFSSSFSVPKLKDTPN